MTVRGTIAAALLAALPTVVGAQGVPVIDGSNLAQNIEQLQAALRDAENQLAQIEELRRQVELSLEQITNLEGILGSISGLNGIADLYNSAEDLRSRAAKIADLDGLIGSLSVGDWDDILDSLLDDEVTMGERRAQEALRETLETAGFDQPTLAGLSNDEGGQGQIIAQTAATNATAMAASQMAYEEAAASLERIDGLVDAIGDQATLKESVDLNTRMAAETNFMLGQMWRLNAAAGLATGQTGVNWAAEQARQRAFFDFGGDYEGGE
ncbi:type IV secretion system protein [Jannaschia sp. 2305UL9-9]|uniref:type IV secretion system protein n=1 Tax=Jannaschia sp. 2305UL9-9 TaxID=3121638 RepID=UPI003526D599